MTDQTDGADAPKAKPIPRIMGRTKKLTPTKFQDAENYLANYRDFGDVIPSAVGLALALNVAESTIYKWAQPDEEGKASDFSEILDRCRSQQHNRLLNGGISGAYNSTITKLMLTKHGYTDKVDNTLASPDGGPLKTESKWQVEFVNADPKLGLALNVSHETSDADN